MKRFFIFPALLACAALLLCLSLPAFAQPKPLKSEAKPKPAADTSKGSDPWQRQIAELKFDNVPLSEVASYLSEPGQFPEINFVVSPGIKDAPITLKLRSVTLDDVFTAMDVATGSAVQYNKISDRMVTITQREAAPVEDTKPVCRAFSLAHYLAGRSEADSGKALSEVEDALKRCWEMLRDADHSSTKAETPQLSLHRATKLLIVVGQPSQVDVVAQVVNQLEQGNATAIDPGTGLPMGNPPAPARFGGGMPGVFSPSTPKPPGGR